MPKDPTLRHGAAGAVARIAEYKRLKAKQKKAAPTKAKTAAKPKSRPSGKTAAVATKRKPTGEAVRKSPVSGASRSTAGKIKGGRKTPGGSTRGALHGARAKAAAQRANKRRREQSPRTNPYIRRRKDSFGRKGQAGSI